MKTFKVYKHPIQGFEPVKIGFSWPAFFFSVFWMLKKKLWSLAGLWGGVFFMAPVIKLIVPVTSNISSILLFFALLFDAFFDIISPVVYSALLLVPGFKGNKWREENLSKRGYESLKTVQAETSEAAVARLAKSE